VARGANVVKVVVTGQTLGVIGGLEMTAPLSVEDERSLYPLIQQGRRAEELLERGASDQSERRRLLRQRHAGQEAESTLLRATLGLVRTRVVERGYRFGNDELEAAGVEALVNALRRFDPEQGNRFSTYANYWIMKLVNQAVQQQAGLTDSEMRLILKLQKLIRANPTKSLTKRDVAQSLGVSQARAHETMQLNRELQSRRYGTTELDDDTDFRVRHDVSDPPSWVIDALRRICGDDFDAFWQFTFRTMSIDEIAGAHGISRQAMTKRMARCRRLVRESPDAHRLLEWFARQ
jgi:DNA-directed RNA polymerase specialized sigma subunit